MYDHPDIDRSDLETPTGPRSRIDGPLHRELASEIVVRRNSHAQADGLMRLDIAASSESPYLRADGWEEPWVEILGHKPGEVDLSRLANGAPVLANHDRFASSGNTPLDRKSVV